MNQQPPRILWHRLVGTLFSELLTPVNITVQTEERLKGLPPKERLKGLSPEEIEAYLQELKKQARPGNGERQS